MNKFAFQADPISGMDIAANTNQGVFQRNRPRGFLQDKNFSLTIRSTDDRTLLETRVEHLHQAFQRLIDWSIGEASCDVCAVMSGPNGFYADHRLKASEDFSWIERNRRKRNNLAIFWSFAVSRTNSEAICATRL
jgi:hypothetical protein